jgi:hypothetical protein
MREVVFHYSGVIIKKSGQGRKISHKENKKGHLLLSGVDMLLNILFISNIGLFASIITGGVYDK